MGSLLLKLEMLPVADAGLFTTLNNGSKGLQSHWDDFARFGGAALCLFAVAFLCIAVAKSRDKARWYWSSAIAFVVGAVLLTTAATSKIEGGFGGTWDEVFGNGGFVNMAPLASAALGGGIKGLATMLPLLF